MSFSFGFGGEDIDIDDGEDASQTAAPQPPSSTTTPVPSAFPVPGKPQLPPTKHSLSSLLAGLPSKIAYGLLDVELDDKSWRKIPRRELWDVRVQLMAEDDGNQGEVEGLGRHDVKTGVYEGGFKSWESSVDLVKVMANQASLFERPLRVIEV
jgi:protein-histidine N-methyltransferase